MAFKRYTRSTSELLIAEEEQNKLISEEKELIEYQNNLTDEQKELLATKKKLINELNDNGIILLDFYFHSHYIINLTEAINTLISVEFKQLANYSKVTSDAISICIADNLKNSMDLYKNGLGTPIYRAYEDHIKINDSAMRIITNYFDTSTHINNILNALCNLIINNTEEIPLYKIRNTIINTTKLSDAAHMEKYFKLAGLPLV